jgi:hypothetical protein
MLIPRSVDFRILKMFPVGGRRRSGCPEINNLITIQEVQARLEVEPHKMSKESA